MPVELVFIHGWGFDAGFWDALAGRLSSFVQTRIDLGFFGTETGKPDHPKSQAPVLVGHSLGFIHGIKQRQGWRGWIAINSFSRFVTASPKPGCATAAELRDIRMRLQAGPGEALRNFYHYAGGKPPAGLPNAERLREGLDELRDEDIGDILETLNIPGLVLASRDDPLVPKAASENLGAFARHGGLVWHDSASHVLPQTSPAWCALAITSFVTAHFGDP